MNILIKSMGAALVTAVILVISDLFGSKIAGIIGGIPIVYAISYVILTSDNKGHASEYLIGGISGTIAAVFFGLFLLFLNSKSPQTHWLNFIGAYVLCAAIAFGLSNLISK